MSETSKTHRRAISLPRPVKAPVHALFGGLIHDVRTMWSIMGVLAFLIAVWPLYELTMQYHYSAKGSILSSAIAVSFGGLLFVSRRSSSGNWTQRLTTLSPFVLTALVYLIIPHKFGLLYALTLALGVQLFSQLTPSAPHNEGSRSELLAKLASMCSEQSAIHLQKLFLYWAPLSLASSLLHRLWPSQLSVCVPMLAFAVFSGSVQNLVASEEPKLNLFRTS